MTNKDILKRTEEVQEQIKHIKYLQHCEKDPEFAELYNGLIDDLELIIINLPVDEEEQDEASRQLLDDVNSFNKD